MSSPPPGKSPAGIPVLLVVAATAIAALLALARLDANVFWDDEALTAGVARNLLEFGRITAWDGTNLMTFGGGFELDENLEVVFIPPMQYWFAAAGMAVFGRDTFGGRVVFALTGVLVVVLTAAWARRFYGREFPWPLPAVLLALSPAYLLFIRCCRYYSPAVLWTTILLLAWSTNASPADSAQTDSTSRNRNRLLFRHLLAICAVAALFATHTLHAVAALGVLPVFFLDPGHRNRRQCALLATIYTTAALGVLWVLAQENPSATLLERRGDPADWLRETTVLFWWHLRDMGFAEFFAWPIVLPLGLPWLLRGLRPLRPVARRALLLAGVIVAYLFVTAVFTPQTAEFTTFADTRYCLPMLVVGTLISAASIFLLWNWNRWISLCVALLLVLTNLFHLGAHQPQPRHDGGKARIRSTLYDYVYELIHPYDTSLDALVKGLKEIPPGSTVYFQPESLCFTGMFYAPDLHYANVLQYSTKVEPELAAQLPDYLYRGRTRPDYVFIISSQMAPPPLLREEFGSGAYLDAAYITTHILDLGRPEVFSHHFYLPPEEYRKSAFNIFVHRLAPLPVQPQ